MNSTLAHRGRHQNEDIRWLATIMQAQGRPYHCRRRSLATSRWDNDCTECTNQRTHLAGNPDCSQPRFARVLGGKRMSAATASAASTPSQMQKLPPERLATSSSSQPEHTPPPHFISYIRYLTLLSVCCTTRVSTTDYTWHI